MIEQYDFGRAVIGQLANQFAADRSARSRHHDARAGDDPFQIAVLDRDFRAAQQFGERHFFDRQTVALVGLGTGPRIAESGNDQIFLLGSRCDAQDLLTVQPLAAFLHHQTDRAFTRAIQFRDDLRQHVG